MMQNTSSIRTSSDGAWQGDNPLNYAFPLLIIQTSLVVFLSRTLAFLLKPLRQPKVIAEILGGIVLGPSAIGRNKHFMKVVFPSWSTPILESVASIGLLFFLFLVGLELDLSSIRRSGKRAFNIAIAGIFLPFLFAVGVTFLLQRLIHSDTHLGYLQHLLFVGVSLSITAFPVLARILAELKLLTTQIGETAMAAAAFNDVAAWILLALAVALAGGGHKSPLTSIWILISGAGFVTLMMLLVRPVMNRVARKCSQENEALDEACICVTLAGVMLSGFVTDLIGIHSIFGAFVFGLTIPKEGEFAGKVSKRVEDFVATLLLPLYFASSGLKTDLGKLKGAEAWGIVLMVITVACVGKILGTFVVAMMSMIPVRESLALGVLMNTKGLVELIVLNIGKEKKVLNDETFTILVLMALFTTFITTPTVMAIYKPSSSAAASSQMCGHSQLPPLNNLKDELRILACIHGTGDDVSSLINFIESIRAPNSNRLQLKLYITQLVELTDRSSSILMVQRNRKDGYPFINHRCRGGAMNDQIATAFEAYGQVGQVTINHLKAISALSTMHQDICHVAEKNRVAMIILPFHHKLATDNMRQQSQRWREVNQRVLHSAPCCVALFATGEAAMPKRVCMVFIGGPDDRKALELGSRMAEHPTIKLAVVRFKDKRTSHNVSISHQNTFEIDKELDEVALNEFKNKWHGSVEYYEKDAGIIMEELLSIGKDKEYELFLVGKGQRLLESTMVANIKDYLPEHAELGAIGDFLTSSGQGITSSVLIIQDRNLANSNQTTISKRAKDKSTTDIESSSV